MTHKKTSHRKRAHKKKPSREEEQELLMEEGLEAIYGKKEDIDFSKLDHDQDRLTKLLIRLVVGLGLVATMAWSGFFVFMNYVNPPRDETFTLEILMDETLVSGEATTIEILDRKRHV